MDGKGVFLWPDGRKYEGNYENDLKSGFGIYCWKDEEKRYEGLWKLGKQEGNGILFQADGTQKKGFWENGKLKTWL